MKRQLNLKRWIYRLLRHRYSRLLRLDKPVGIYLALYPALWAVLIAGQSIGQVLLYSVVMLLGAVAARSAGCIANDYWDREIDKQVKRTSARPLASGEVSLKEAFWLFCLTGGGAVGLLFLLPQNALLAGLMSIPLIIIYPLLKRFTFYPQVVLGLAFNMGVFIGWYAILPHVSYVTIVLYVASVLWTIGYDSIYGLQDMLDDVKVGVKSLPLKLGSSTADLAWMLYRIMMILIALIGVALGFSIIFYPLLGLAVYYLYWQTATLDPQSPENCKHRFCSNVHVGMLIWLALLLGKWLR